MVNSRINRKKIVCLGGGTGTFVVLSGLKQYPCDLSVIVTMSDSGGSNKRIRDEFGLLPTSDIRQCLIALSKEQGRTGLLRKLFMYRFEKGNGITGMTFGNLFMAALSDILGSQEEAIKQTGKVLNISGNIIPVTFSKTNLYAQYENGTEVAGEALIDEPEHDGTVKITNTYLKPTPTTNKEALEAIAKAEVIVMGPGDLYTSLLPNLLVPGVAEAIKKSKAKKVYVLNLMTKYGQTYNMTALDHVHVLEGYIGKSLDMVIVNTATYPEPVLQRYEEMHEFPIEDDLGATNYFSIVREKLISDTLYVKPKSDTLVRSLIRHDEAKLAKVLFEHI